MSEQNEKSDIFEASYIDLNRPRNENHIHQQSEYIVEEEDKDEADEKNSQDNDNEEKKNEAAKSNKLKFLTPKQRHVLVGIVGLLIVGLMSYLLLYVLTLLKV